MANLLAEEKRSVDTWRALLDLCGGTIRLAVEASFCLQVRAGVEPKRDNTPDLSLLSQDEIAVLGRGEMPKTLRDEKFKEAVGVGVG